MRKTDTSKESMDVLVGLYRQMPPEEKLRRVFDAYAMGRRLAMAGVRDLHPDWNERQVWREWARRHLGEELFEKVYGARDDE
jgi:hypothetical protein